MGATGFKLKPLDKKNTPMGIHIVFSALLVTTLTLVVVIIQFVHYRRAKRRKDASIMACIRQHDHLLKELERTRIEKELLETLVRKQLKDAEHPDKPQQSA